MRCMQIHWRPLKQELIVTLPQGCGFPFVINDTADLQSTMIRASWFFLGILHWNLQWPPRPDQRGWARGQLWQITYRFSVLLALLEQIVHMLHEIAPSQPVVVEYVPVWHLLHNEDASAPALTVFKQPKVIVWSMRHNVGLVTKSCNKWRLCNYTNFLDLRLESQRILSH